MHTENKMDNVLDILSTIAHYIRDEGELGPYDFSYKSTTPHHEALEFCWADGKIIIGHNNIMTEVWTDAGIQYKRYMRYSTEEERFMMMTLRDVVSTEAEDALALLIRNLFAYLRDGMTAYREHLYTNGLDGP
jgi:hypothetical protein